MSLKQQILLFLVPLLFALTVSSGYQMFQNYKLWKQSAGLKTSTEYLTAISGVVHNIQNERGLSILFLNKIAPKEDLDEQRNLLNEKIKVMETVLPHVSHVTAEATRNVLKELEGARKAVDGQLDESEALKDYAGMVDQLIKLEVARSQEYPMNGLENRLISQSIFEGSKESIAKLRGTVSSILKQKKPIDAKTQFTVLSYKEEVESNLASFGLIISSDTRQKLNEFMTSNAWLIIPNAVEDVFENATTGKFKGEANQFFGLVSAAHDTIYTFITDETAKIESEVTSTYNYARAVFWTFLFITLFGLAFIITLSFWSINQITQEIEHISKDLIEGASSTGFLAKDMSSSSTSLAEGVTEQAAALQETVASLEEVRAMVSKNADNAEQARTVATQTSENARKGKASVSEVISAISEILHSNEAIQHQVEMSNNEMNEITRVISDIASKTKVINEIVFQTKLLSFNASVEAARAGEHGKGFAVVAEEVGNLAQMSGTAAREITQLLEGGLKKVETIVKDSKSKVSNLVVTSKEKVELGTTTARRCDTVLDELLGGVDEMNNMVVEIATASQEQSQGVNEISKAMNQLEAVTQNNSAATNEVSTVAVED